MQALRHTLRMGNLLVCFMCVLPAALRAQQIGYSLPDGVNKVEIPFERYNNLVVIPVTINNSLTLKFILDTGVQFAILTEKAFGEVLGLQYARRLIIRGPGQIDSISAQVATRINMELPGGVRSGMNQSLLVLEQDYLHLRKTLGADVYGIIGYDIFSRFVVEVNYDDGILTLHEPKHFRPKKSRKRVQMQVVNTKPYIAVDLTFDTGRTERMNLMVDTGASHSILLDEDSDHVFMPSKTLKTVIGRGLGGNISGVLGRVQKVKISKFEFEEPIASFPMEGHYASSIKRGSRHGTIGSEILTRFNPIYDYLRGILFLRKSRKYYKDFEHDMSGLEIQAGGSKLDMIRVVAVRENSPADLAGVKAHDVITSVNGIDTKELKFAAITTALRAKPGKRINLRLKREGQLIKKSFKLKRMI